MKQNSSHWHQACSIHELDEEEPLSLMIGSTAVAIYQIGSTYYARENICPHAYAVLTDGFYDEGIIECPIHQASFDIISGDCISGPAQRGLKKYELKKEGDNLMILLD